MGAIDHAVQIQDPIETPGQLRERFEGFLELSRAVFWEQDENYRFTLVASGSRAGRSLDAGIRLGSVRWDDGAIPVGDDGGWERHPALLDARLPFIDFVFSRATVDGGFCYISTSGQPVFDGTGRFRGYRGLARDVTT